MDYEDIFEENAFVFLFDDKCITEDVYKTSQGSFICPYYFDTEVYRLSKSEKLYYGFNETEMNKTVWRENPTMKRVFELKGSSNNPNYEYENFITYAYQNIDSYLMLQIGKNYREYYDYSDWIKIFMSDRMEFDFLKSIFSKYVGGYCYFSGFMPSNKNPYQFREFLEIIRKFRIDKFKRGRKYIYFEDTYSNDKIIGLKGLFQQPIKEDDVKMLEQRISEDESLEDLYKIVEIYPYIKFEECFQKSVTFKQKYYELKKIMGYEDDKEKRIITTKMEEIEVVNEIVVDMNNKSVSAIWKGIKRDKELMTSRKMEKPKPKRNAEIAANALMIANHICEYDNTHKVFLRKNSETNYTEPHHLIPMCNHPDFKYNLDVEENIISLCSHCHNLLHYGRIEDKTPILRKLYEERKDALKTVGLELKKFEDLKKYYL